MPQVAVKLSELSFAKLKRLAHQRMVNYATIVEAALTAYQPETSTASEQASLIPNNQQDVIHAVLTRLETLETQLAAMQAGTAQNRAVGVAVGQGIVGQPQDQEAAEIAVEAGLSESVIGDSMERESGEPETTSFSILSSPRAFADLSEPEKQRWRRVMLDWQNSGLSNPKISKKLWEEQRLGQYTAGKLAALDRNRVKVEIDRVKGK